MGGKSTSKAKLKTSLKQDARQMRFLELYLTPGTRFFSSAYASAIEAGFSKNTAKNILQHKFKWLEDGIRKVQGDSVSIDSLASKARKVLSRTLDSEDAYLAQNTAKFVAGRIDPEFTQKQEINHHFPEPIYGGKSKTEVEESEV